MVPFININIHNTLYLLSLTFAQSKSAPPVFTPDPIVHYQAASCLNLMAPLPPASAVKISPVPQLALEYGESDSDTDENEPDHLARPNGTQLHQRRLFNLRTTAQVDPITSGKSNETEDDDTTHDVLVKSDNDSPPYDPT
jgi:hypothetical protein